LYEVPAISSQPQPDNRIAIGTRNAYHQAGHAAAIYLGNKQKQLPVVFFQIVVTPHKQTGQSDERLTQSFSQYQIFYIYRALNVPCIANITNIVNSLSIRISFSSFADELGFFNHGVTYA
jgi:hypothetical protein